MADYMFDPTLPELRGENWRDLYQAIPSLAVGTALAVRAARQLEGRDLLTAFIDKPLPAAIFTGGVALLGFGLQKLHEASQLWPEINRLKAGE